MALLFMDGFDHYIEAQAINRGWIFAGNVTAWSSSYARFGGQGVIISLGSSAGYLMHRNIGVSKTTICFGIAFKKSELGSVTYTNSCPFIFFKDDSEVYQVKIHLNSNYGFSAYDGSDSLLGSSSDFLFADNACWHYIETKVTISATVGEVTINLDGTQVLNLTSQDTKNGSDYIRHCGFGAVNDRSTWFDDLYIDDAQFHGDCRIRVFLPDSISPTNNDFTASAGNKDECVDEQLSNDDTDYIVSDTLNHKQGFGITTGSLGTVKGVQLNNHVRIDEAGTRKITPLIRSNGTDYSGTETPAISANYVFESEIFETDPDDSNPWTQTKLEAAEFGLEITT